MWSVGFCLFVLLLKQLSGTCYYDNIFFFSLVHFLRFSINVIILLLRRFSHRQLFFSVPIYRPVSHAGTLKRVPTKVNQLIHSHLYIFLIDLFPFFFPPCIPRIPCTSMWKETGGWTT